MFKFLNKKKTTSGKSFFDYPAAEKKKIIIKAALGASKAQMALVKEYDRRYSE